MIFNRASHPGSHSWDYYPGTLSLSQVTTTHSKIEHLWISWTGAQSMELQWFADMIGYQDSKPSNSHQMTAPVWLGSAAQEWNVFRRKDC